MNILKKIYNLYFIVIFIIIINNHEGENNLRKTSLLKDTENPKQSVTVSMIKLDVRI